MIVKTGTYPRYSKDGKTIECICGHINYDDENFEVVEGKTHEEVLSKMCEKVSCGKPETTDFIVDTIK